MYSKLWFLVLCLTVGLIDCYDDWVYKTVRDVEEKNENIDPCGICRIMTESFKKAFDATDNNIQQQPNYENSEVRLTEIQEQLCLDQQYGKNKCLRLAQEREDEIEYWWWNLKEKETLFQHLCIRKLKLCCMPGQFGPNCKKCPGAPNNICNKNGKCDGEGTRAGNGSCICDEGSQGVECEECKINFVKTDSGKCEKCDQACKNGCFKPGKEGCVEGKDGEGTCSAGFRTDEKNVCQDIDECSEDKNVCPEGKVCQNAYGTHHCIDCDKECKTCYGLSKDQCIECANGFVKEGKKCVPYEESRTSNLVEIAKYLAYVVLTCFSCFLMKERPLVALVLTVFLSTYIGLSEYAKLKSLDSAMQAFEELWL